MNVNLFGLLIKKQDTAGATTYFMHCSLLVMQMNAKGVKVLHASFPRAPVKTCVPNSSLSFTHNKNILQSQNLPLTLSFYMKKNDLMSNEASWGLLDGPQ